MPNRIIKESICTSESMAELSWFDQAVFIRLIVLADDYGRFDARPAIIKGRGFPLSSVTDRQIGDSLSHLVTAGMVDLYDVGGKPFLQLKAWQNHQSIRAQKSKYPVPDDDLQADEINCMQLHADASKCPRNPIQSESESESKEKARATRFIPPQVDEVKAYCRERNNHVDPQQFVDFYASKGWKVGSEPMKDWRAAVRTWEKRESYARTPRKPSKAHACAENPLCDEDVSHLIVDLDGEV